MPGCKIGCCAYAGALSSSLTILPAPCSAPTPPPVRSWRLGPVLAGVIVASVCTAFLYRRQTRSLEAGSAAAQQRLAELASASFTNMRTVRIFAGEALEQR